jgi:WD40 repeat protein
VGGTLYKNDGSTAISNGNFITEAEGNAGLKFTPALNSITGGSFGVQSSIANNDSGLGGNVMTATIAVNPVNDKPSFTASNPPTVNEDAIAQTITTWITSFNPGPTNENGQQVSDYLIANIGNPDLFAIAPDVDDYGTLTYIVAANTYGVSTFTVKVRDDGGTNGIDISEPQTFTITVNTIADVPSVTNATTNEDTQTNSGLVITDNGDNSVSHFKITNIVGGTLYQNDGSTAINNGDFITETEGNAGLKFSPTPDTNIGGSFAVQSSLAADNNGLGGNIVTATITVNSINDKPYFTASNPPAITEDAGAQTVTGWISSFNPGPANESGQIVSTYIINNISNAGLFSGGPTIDNSGNLTYTPVLDAFGNSTFDVKVQDNGGTANGGIDTSDAQTFTITINTMADVPNVTNATTNEDTQTKSGLVITDNGDTEVSHFKITNIMGGTLYKNDGSTAINNADFITEASGNAGLKFTPATDANIGGSFGIQASVTNDNSGLGGNVVTAMISVNPVNDIPSFAASNPPVVIEDASTQTITGWIASFEPGGGSDESGQTVKAYIVANVSAPSLFSVPPAIDNFGNLTYTPAANTSGSSTFEVKVQNSGGVDNGGVDTSVAKTFTITVTPKPVTAPPEPVVTPEPVITPEPVTTSPTGVTGTSEAGILQFALTTYFASERDGELQTITVTRTENSKGNVSIQYFASANGTAISEVDYISGIGTLTWADGDIQPKVLPLTILADDETEGLETVNLMLFNPTGHATLGSLAQTTLIIVDSTLATESATVVNPATEEESTTTVSSGAGKLQFSASFYPATEDMGILTTLNVIRTGGSEGEVSVQYTILDNGTAAFNFDYIGGAGQLIWADGDSSAKSIPIMLLDDQQLEDLKTIPLILTEPTGGASIGVPDRVTVVVVDNDGQPEEPPQSQVESEFTPSQDEPTSGSSPDKGKAAIAPSPDDSEYTNTSSLPSLGRSIAVAKDGNMLNANVLEEVTGITIAFRGGASIGGSQTYHSNITTTPSHKVKIRGEIDIANIHIGQKADILVLVGVLDDVSGTVQFLMFDQAQLQVWDGGFATLVGSEVVLSQTQTLKIYHGFIEPVHVQIYFGYRLQKNGLIYFNGEQPIELEIGSEDDSSQEQQNQQVVWHTEFSPNGEQIVIASSAGHVSLWDANNGHRLARLTAHTAKVKSAVFSADSKWLVTSSHDKTARLWNVNTKQEVMVFSGHEGALEYATFSPNAQRILTVSADKTARLWDVNSGETLFILEGHNQGIQYATFSHDGKRVVTASWDHTARLWDAETGEEIAMLAGHTNMVEHAAFSPNDQYIITASWDKTARLWDAYTGQEILALAGHRNGVAYATFSPDGEYIVTTSWDNSVRLWNAKNGKSLWVREHQAGVHHAAFSPNSQIIVTGSNDSTARLWESATGRPIKTLKGHEGNVWQVGFSPDGKQVISASWDNTVRVWEVESGNVVMVLKD